MSSYKYSIELKYIKTDKNEAITFQPFQIKSLVIEREFDPNNMPMVFLTASIDKKVIDDMMDNQNKNLMNLTVYKITESTDLPDIKTIYFREQFVYFIYEYAIEKSYELTYKFEENKGNIFENLSIGLIKLDSINANKTTFNTIINNTTMINAIHLCTKHLPMVIEPLTYNNMIKSLIIPPMDSVSKILKYLNDEISVFYSTPYRFFIDFEYAYLLSSSGKATPSKGSNINTVIIDIKKKLNLASIESGMTIDKENNAYLINVNDFDARTAMNRLTEKSFNQISASGTDGMVGSTDVDVNNSSYSTSKTKFIRVSNNNNNYLNTLKAQAESNRAIVTVNKNNLDVSIFTPNKEYIVKNYDPGEEYTEGKFILAKSQEIYTRIDGDKFLANTLLTLKQV